MVYVCIQGTEHSECVEWGLLEQTLQLVLLPDLGQVVLGNMLLQFMQV